MAVTVVRTHRYSVDPTDIDELIARRAALIAAVRAVHPGSLTRTVLTRLTDGSYTDAWYWNSAEQMRTAGATARSRPEAADALALVHDQTDEDGEVLDDR